MRIVEDFAVRFGGIELDDRWMRWERWVKRMMMTVLVAQDS